MKRICLTVLSLCVLVVLIAACGNQAATPNGAAFDTIVAQSVQLTQLSSTLTAVSQVTSVPPTATATLNPTETQTPAPSITPTREGVWLSFTQNTNCRSGPGTSYPLIKTFSQYDQAQAVSRSTDGLYLIVTFTDSYVQYCWVLKQYAVISGDTDRLPAITPMPTNTPTITPTPAAGFTLSFNGINSCAGKTYVRVLITNTGYLTWKSMKITVKDNTTGDSMTETSDDFTGYKACAIDQTQSDLITGEFGIVSNFASSFAYDLNDHSLTITVVVYSEDGQSGSSATQSIAVTP